MNFNGSYLFLYHKIEKIDRNEYFEAIELLKEHNCDIMSRKKEVI